MKHMALSARQNQLRMGWYDVLASIISGFRLALNHLDLTRLATRWDGSSNLIRYIGREVPHYIV